jgi:hypothetical protein
MSTLGRAGGEQNDIQVRGTDFGPDRALRVP